LPTLAARRLLADTPALIAGPDKAFELGQRLGAPASSGGRGINATELTSLRAGIVEVARSSGFPNGGDAVSRARFDADMAAWWGEQAPIATGEALRDEIWAWLTICLLPDVAGWRFQKHSVDRFLGGVRNTFQRQWMRALSLDRGPGPERWALVYALTEDAMVQIMERPSIAGQPELARAIAEVWIETADVLGAGPMEDLMRAAIRDIRIVNETAMIAQLPAGELTRLIRAGFAAAYGAPIEANGPAAVEEPRKARRSMLDLLRGRDG